MKKQKPMIEIIYLSSSSYPKSENKKVEIETNDIASEASTPDIKVKYVSKIMDEEQDANGTEDNSFYDQPTEDKPAISDFNLDQPKGLRRQRIGSNDCRVWVAEWMKGLMWHDDYDKILVQPATRMRLALDLVLHPYNKMEDEVIQNAFQLWSDQEKKRKKLVKF